MSATPYSQAIDSDSEHELRTRLEQPTCDGSCPLMSITFSFCIFFIAAPTIILVLSSHDILAATYAIPIGCALFGVGFLICCFYSIPLLQPRPANPPPTFPLTAPAQSPRPPKNVYVLVNPKGGKGNAQRIFDQLIAPKLTQAGVRFSKVPTEYSGHCRDLCRTLPLEGFDGIIAVGGDGTFNECVNGFLSRTDDRSQVALGLIPAGSGNSFLHDFCVQNHPEALVDAIIAGNVAPLDANRVQYGDNPERDFVYSINVFALSADHCMGALNIDKWRGLLGTARYDVCALWGLLKGRSMRIKATVDGKESVHDLSVAFINNTQHFGKGMRAAPFAYLDDGMCDVGLIAGSRCRILRLFSMVKGGAHHSMLSAFKASNVRIEMPTREGLFNLDGEVLRFKNHVIEAKVIKGAFLMYVPTRKQFDSKYLPTASVVGM